MPAADPLALRAAILAGLVCGNPARGWLELRQTMEREPQLARMTLLWLVDREPQAWVSELSPTELAGLYCFMCEHFPRDERCLENEEPPDWEVIRFRDRIPQWIAEIGTEEAVDILDSLAERFPEQQEMWAQYRQHARRRLRENTYRPPKPADLLRLEQDARTRLVRSDAELMELIIESLQSLEDMLQGRTGGTPVGRAVWNECGGKNWKPKEENFLSDYVQQHLRNDLVERQVLANREVELRAAKSGDGQQIDILVRAVKKHGNEEPVPTVVIEVKGCWNPELGTAMKAQLRDRYLKDNGYRCGIYLVGWFVCDRWPRARVAKRKARPEDTIGAWRGRLAQQAQDLSVNGFRLRAFVLDARAGPATSRGSGETSDR